MMRPRWFEANLLAAALSVAALIGGSCFAIATERWHPIDASDWATVSVEKSLYEKRGSPDVYVHVLITNKLTDRKIAVNLNDRDNTLYPNQWGYSRRPFRGVINERRFGTLPLDDSKREQLKAAFATQTLKPIEPAGKLDYFIKLDRRREFDLLEKDKFFIVTMDGELRFTDGVPKDAIVIE
jgi:hypothetical protein